MLSGLRFVVFGVELRLRGVDRLDVVERPGSEGADRFLEGMAKLRQLVIDARRDARGDRPADQPIALKIAQRERQHPLRYAGNLAPQLVEAPGPLCQRSD